MLNSFSLHAQSEAGNALRFNGTNSYVSIPHNVALNAYPLTITAWIKTLRNTSLVDGIVNKYADGTFNGYSLLLNNGTLYAFYSRANGNYVFAAPLGINGGFIADGHWHHVAFTITATGGQLFVDGNLVGALGWAGAAGGITTTEPLLIGQYYTNSVYPNTFQGEIDEVTFWNRALHANEINYLKHRRLSGTEDGLLGYWRFDEGSGTVANNIATNAFHGTIANVPAWVESHAAIALEPVATNCLKLNGVNQFVSVPHAADLNAFPLTISAWIKTSRNAATIDGIASKYVESSLNGYSLFLHNGRLRAWYFKDSINRIWDGGFGVDGGFIADGNWHHIAFVVNTNRGQFFVDGVPTGSLNWTGAPGAPTTVTNLQIGQYWLNPNYPGFNGSIDEVAVWNRALTTNEIISNKNLLLAGNETNLVAYWRLDEGTGINIADATGLGHTGTLTNGPAWIGSTAYLGDGSVHLVAATGIPNFTRQYAIKTAPGKETFSVIGRAFLRRFYDFGPAPASVDLDTKLAVNLQVAGSGAPVPTKPNTITNNFSMTSYNASSPQPLVFGGIAAFPLTIFVEPDGVQLDSVNNLHEGRVTLSHRENAGAFSDDGANLTLPARLLHFNGHVFFGGIDTVVNNFINAPTNGTITTPSHLASQLQIASGGAHLAIAPGFQFGGGAAFNVNLGADGNATNLNGSFSLANPNQFFETNGIRYQLPGAALNASGMVASNLLAWFPAGFGLTTSTNNRAMLPYASKTNVALGPDLLPASSPVVFTAASYNTNRLYFSEETKPFLIGAAQIEWRIPQGEFFISEAQTLTFVRQKEDDDLVAEFPFLVDQRAWYRISNDNLYRNIAAVAGVPVYVRPDTNGTALLTIQASLQPGTFNYRTHFPYMGGQSIQAGQGALVVTNDLIDTAASYLLLNTPVEMTYGRDCLPEGGCGSAALVGAKTLFFSPPPGPFGPRQFSFTPEGGLLAYGSISPDNLTWGFVGGSDYAQRTSDVTNGVGYFAGTFLKADDLAGEQDARRPARLLLSGYGSADTNDFTSVERPGAANYGEGLANYPGLNFRAPAQGRSVIAGTDTGLYPLTARSKYYVRFGGVSGIHESASFPANLTLYGYPFTFQSYRLSFLDSDNYESRTDGVISLPVPSGFPVEFERMKFLCRGNLDSARLPANIETKHLVYWNADLSLLSLQFKPRASDPCSLTNRYLVLGVETKLPFIVETNSPNTLKALHASLAIKSNGNLATSATGVEGVDSRFAVPANLRLQGPGGSFYPITTAGDGYFNNWETPGRPANGFYSLVGRIRVPFFRDIKTQFHVTPSSPTNAQVQLMGGWPAEEGLGANRGWNNGTENYFNKPKFDPTHAGWPSGVSIANYRNSPDEQYRQRAQQNWIDVAIFNYPLVWNSVLRSFSGFADAEVILPVIDVDSRLKQISPGKVDFDFAQDVNLQLPRIKVLDFANDALNELNAPINTISNAIRDAVTEAINTTGLTSGFRSLQNLMRENSEGLFRPVLDSALTDPANHVVDKLYAALAAELAVSKSNLLVKTSSTISASSNGLQTAIMNLNGTAVQPNKLFGHLDRTLADVDDTLGLFIRVLKKDGDGNRNVVRTIVQKLVQDQGPELGFAVNLGGDVVDGLLANLEPTLAKIEAEMQQLRSEFSNIRMQVGRVVVDDDFADSLDGVNNSTAAQGYLQLAGGSMSNLFSAAVGPAGDYFTADPARAKREIKERLTIAFLSSSLTANYQTAFRQFLYDKNFLLNQLTDVLFDQVNRSIRDGLSSHIAGATDSVFQGMKGAGAMGGSLLSAKIRGAPTFEGDSLRNIHLDSEIKMNLPDEMKFMAYMDIKELNSQSTALSCIPEGKPAAEVTLGAKEIPLDWLGVSGGGPLKLNIEARWTLQSSAVLGIGGSFEVLGKIGFKGGSINDFGASLAIGQFENYLAAKAGATVTIIAIPVDFNVGIFAGRACTLDPLKFIDPEVEEVLITGANEFTGIYLQFGAGVSLSDILFGGSSCLLDVSGSVNYALFYQGGPRFGSIGGRQKLGLSADLICIISAEASWAMGYRLDTEGKLSMAGKARLCGKVGACPFCLKACATLSVSGTVTDGGVDYSIDF